MITKELSELSKNYNFINLLSIIGLILIVLHILIISIVNSCDCIFLKYKDFVWIFISVISIDFFLVFLLIIIIIKKPYLMFGPRDILNEFSLAMYNNLLKPTSQTDMKNKFEEDISLENVNAEKTVDLTEKTDMSNKVKNWKKKYYNIKDNNKLQEFLIKIESATLDKLRQEYPGLITNRKIEWYGHNYYIDAIYRDKKKDTLFDIKIYRKKISVSTMANFINNITNYTGIYRNITLKPKVEVILAIVSDYGNLGGTKYKDYLQETFNRLVNEREGISIRFIDINDIELENYI